MSTILGYIGNTPMVKLKNKNIYLKLEGFNPGERVKDRIAYYMINKAEKDGILKKDTVLIEPSSGNTGIGLAMVAAVHAALQKYNEEKGVYAVILPDGGMRYLSIL